MTAYALPNWVVDLLGLCMSRGPDVRLVDAAWEWRPAYPATALALALGVLWVTAVVVHRSRRIELPWPWRLSLSLLRATVLAVPVFMLFQPALSARFERIKPKTLAVLLDRSGSMSVRDDTRGLVSRWGSALATLRPTLDPPGQPRTTDSARVVATQPVRLQAYLFDENVSTIPWRDLKSGAEPLPERRTAIGNALRSIRAAVSGEPNAGVGCFLLISDGADNSSTGDDEPVRVARELGRDGIAVHAILVGNEHPRDLGVAAIAEAPFAFPGDPVPLQVRIEHQGFGGSSVAVAVREGDRSLAVKDAALPADGQPAVDRIDVKFDSPGRKQCRVEVAPLAGELTTANNTALIDIQVVEQPIRVLYIEHWPRWQYRFLRNAFQRDKRFETRLVLLTEDPSAPREERQAAPVPATAEEFSKFDCIVIGDVARQDLSPQQWQWIHDCVVNDGAGAVFIAGPAHNPAEFLEAPGSNPTGSLLPFERVVTVSEEEVSTFKPVLTPLGLNHPLLRLGTADKPAEVASIWRQMPGMQWYAVVKDLKPGAMVLAERQPESGGDPTPLIILQRAGRGSVLFVGTDETWRWRYQAGNQYFYGFWAQAIQHVGMPHRVGEFKAVRIDTAARTVARDAPLPVSVAIEASASASGAGAETIKLIAERKEGGTPAAFVLRRSADVPFLFQGEVRIGMEGTYKLSVEERGGQGERFIEVKAAGQFNPELAAPAVNAGLMRRIAEASGGRYVTIDQLPALVSGLDLAPLRFRWTERIVLWDGWALLLILMVLLTVEWVLRKLRYLP